MEFTVGDIVRTWGGNRARVVRVLDHNHYLIDFLEFNYQHTYTGRELALDDAAASAAPPGTAPTQPTSRPRSDRQAARRGGAAELDDLFDGWAHEDAAGRQAARPRCAHWRVSFTLIDRKGREFPVYLSAGSCPPAQRVNPTVAPVAAVYLDSMWNRSRQDRFLTNGHWRYDPKFEVLYVSWPDMGVIPVEDLQHACAWAWRRVLKRRALELGCIGGHGRTGTLAAALLVYAGMGANEAIAEVRSAYCAKAIESASQEALLRDFAKHMKEVAEKA